MFHEFMQMGSGAAWAIVGACLAVAIVIVVVRIFNYFEESERRTDRRYREEAAANARQIEGKRIRDASTGHSHG